MVKLWLKITTHKVTIILFLEAITITITNHNILFSRNFQLWLNYGYFMVTFWLFYGYFMVKLWLNYGYHFG